MDLIRHVIGGREVESVSGARFATVDPWTRAPYAEVALGSAADADRAVTAARKAFDEGPWPRMGFAERGALLHRLATLVEEHAAELAMADTRDMGKPITDARTKDVPRTAANLRFFADHARLATGELLPMDGGHHAYTLFPPAGVVAAIAPWNFPLMLESWKVAPALAWGNTVVLKPAEETSLSTLRLVELAEEAGFPPGVINVVTGPGSVVGAAIAAHPGVDKVAFTGSTATAKKVMATCAETLTPILVECGGKDALLVDHDADLDDAAAAAVWGAMSNAGQTCVGVERVYVVDSVAEAFLDKVAQRAAKIQPGAGPRSIYGPITMPGQIGIISGQIDDALSRGGRAVVGGRDSVRAPYVDPVVLADVPEDSSAVTDETFGPTVVVNRVRDIDEAVERANASRYGLGGSVFAKKRGYEIARKLRVGMVSVNGVIAFAAMPSLPFGGVGDSGFGRIHGRDGLREFTRALAVSERRFKSINVMTFDRPGWVVKAMTLVAGLIYRRNR
jgi:acyl-CoA reductase-like NAD-dependent aldehyde dehydrogenase